MSVIVRPTADGVDPGYVEFQQWHNQTCSLPANWYSLIADQSNATYWRISCGTYLGFDNIIGLQAVLLDSPTWSTSPATSGHKIYLTVGKVGTQIDGAIAVAVYQGDPNDGGSQLFNRTFDDADIPAGPANIEVALTDEEIALITDYDTLYVLVTGNSTMSPDQYPIIYELWGSWEEEVIPTVALTGTVTNSIDGDDVRAGGNTAILTLTDTTWVASGATFNAVRQAIIDGFVSAQSEADGWNAQRANISVTAVVRTSDTIVTITLPELADYDTTAQETITATVPASATEYGQALVASPTFTIDDICLKRLELYYSKDGGSTWTFAKMVRLPSDTKKHLFKYKRGIRARRLMWKLVAPCGKVEILDYELRIVGEAEATDKV